jgi:alpha-tubulin suppressor-like RCC1 family protein
MKKLFLVIGLLLFVAVSGCENFKGLFEKVAKPHSARELIFSKISSGSYYNLALTKKGMLYSVGWNSMGQLGDGTYKERQLWRAVLKNIKAISAGDSHSFAVSKDGSLWGTGNNAHGQLGVRGAKKRNKWIKVFKNVVAISAGESHSLLLTNNGNVYSSGYNKYGQLGTGDNKTYYKWQKVLTGVVAISAGSEHSLALKRNGTLWATGRNAFGQYGIGKVRGRSKWVKVLSKVKAIDCHNSSSSLAIKKDKTLWVTGWNLSNQLGIKKIALSDDEWIDEDEESSAHQYEWVKVMKKVEKVSAGRDHSIATQKGGSIWVTGDNRLGQLGTGDGQSRGDWTQILLEEGHLSLGLDVCAGRNNSLAITSGGLLWVVGDNSNGQLGKPKVEMSKSDHWLKVEEVARP